MPKHHQQTLVLLPGMDGTGILFSPLIDLLPESVKVKVVPLRISREIESSFHDVTTTELAGPHFLAQTNNSEIILSIIQ